MYTTYSFTVTNNLYARDTSTVAEAGTYYGWLTGANASPEEVIEPGNIYDIFNTTDVTGIDFQIGDLAPEGAEVFGQIYDANLDPVAGGETQSYIIQSGDEGKYVTLVYETPLTLAPGEYVVTVQCFDTQFSVASAGSSAPQTSFVYYPNETTWYYTTSTPVDRKSTRLNSSHVRTSYAVFCLKKKKSTGPPCDVSTPPRSLARRGLCSAPYSPACATSPNVAPPSWRSQ